MLYLEFDEERLIKEYSVSGDIKMNAQQLAHIMAEDERVAAIVAQAIPWYAMLTEEICDETSAKRMECVSDDPHDFLIQASELV